MLPPASKPNDFEIIEYAPPAPIFIFVVIEDIDNPVHIVTELAIKIIATAPRNPAFPTTQPKRKYIIMPSIVKTSGVNTPAKVPNFEPVFFFPNAILFMKETNLFGLVSFIVGCLLTSCFAFTFVFVIVKSCCGVRKIDIIAISELSQDVFPDNLAGASTFSWIAEVTNCEENP